MLPSRRFGGYDHAAGTLFTLTVTIGLNIITARALGAGEYGTLSLARSILLTLLPLASFGMDLALLRFLPMSEGQAAANFLRFARFSSMNRALLMTLAVAAAAAPLSATLYDNSALTATLILTICALPFLTDSIVLSAVGRVRQELGVFVGTNLLLQPALRAALTIGVLALSPRVELVALASTVGIAMAWAIHSRLEGSGFADARERATQFLAALPEFKNTARVLGGTVFFYGLMRTADVVILGGFVSPAELGGYAVISFIAAVVQTIPTSLSQSVGSEISSAGTGDTSNVRRILGRAVTRALPASLFLYGGVAVFSQDLHLIFGQSFAAPGQVGFFLSTGYLLGGVLAPTGYALSMAGHHRLERFIVIGGGAALLLLVYLGARSAGAEGTAIATCLGIVLLNVARTGAVWKIYRFLTPGLWKLLLAFPVLGLAFTAREVTKALGSHPIEGLVLGTAAYTAGFGVVYIALLKAAQHQKVGDDGEQ